MASITYDGQSLILDGRRLWIVSASVQYARIAGAEWADRIHAAKVAGFNTVETPVVWSRHETRAGHFEFGGDNDLRRFVRLVGDAGLMCLLRIGPFVGEGFDGGGVPAWLLDAPGVRPRTNSGPYLEACSRFITAVSEQVRDLQATNPGRPGPIVLVQNEGAWTCGDDALAAAYLGELHRYIREAGLTVPIIGAHNLWTSVEGEIDAWSGSGEPLAVMRQLAAVRPDRPRLIVDLRASDDDGRSPAGAWGGREAQPADGAELTRRISQTLAGGGQFNVRPFHEGTNFGFSGGRLAGAVARFSAARSDPGAPLAENGSAAPGYRELRRIVTFASRFGRIFSNLNRAFRPIVIDPQRPVPSPDTPRRARAGAPDGPPTTVIPCTGTQGSVAFVFASPSPGSVRATTLMLAEGTTLPVDLRDQSVVWCLINAALSARATLDYCNLSAVASIGRVFVCFGPAGARGMLSINGTPVEVTVQDGRTPAIIEVENTTVVACSLEQIDSTYITDSAVFVGVLGVTADGTPMVPAAGAGARSFTRIDAEGKVTHAGPTARVSDPSPDRPVLGPWISAGVEEYVSGESPRFASISGPATLSSLGAGYGYGWYRVTPRGSDSRTARVSVPQGGDRLHVFQGGKPLGILGVGPGSTSEVPGAMKKGSPPIVVLADNLGRFSEGAGMGEPKGLHGHLWELKALRAPRPRLVDAAPIDVLSFRTPLWEIGPGDSTHHERVSWSVPRRTRGALVIRIDPVDGVVLPSRVVVVVNNRPLAYIDESGPATLVLEPESTGRGAANVQFAPIPGGLSGDELLRELAPRVEFLEAAECLSHKADWAFAKWEIPAASAFSPGARARGPTWWRTTLKAPVGSGPVVLELDGMTKGQIYLNNRHLARYFVATAEGKAVGPITSQWIPPSWLRSGLNDLVLFDEHGGHPSRCRVGVGAGSRPIRATVAGA